MESPSYQQHLEWVRRRQEGLAGELSKLFPDPTDLTLEIGCGHGHWLVEYAAAFPRKRCLGVDLISDRIQRANRKKERAGLENVRFLKAEAFEMLDLLPERVRLAEVFLLFLDPWPKKRHWKHRLFNRPFLEGLAKRCGSGTRCYFRTDHVGYFEWAEEVLAGQTLWRRDDATPWPFERETVFQARADAYRSLTIVKK